MNVKEIKARKKLTIKDILNLSSAPSRQELQDALRSNIDSTADCAPLERIFAERPKLRDPAPMTDDMPT